jgi:hypothetical protein
MMFVRDIPLIADFAETNREAKIQPFTHTAGSKFSATHRRDDKRNVTPGIDSHRSDVENDRITGTGKEQVPGLLVGFDALGLKGWGNIEHHNIQRMILQYPFKISEAYGGCPGLNYIANCRLFL